MSSALGDKLLDLNKKMHKTPQAAATATATAAATAASNCGSDAGEVVNPDDGHMRNVTSSCSTNSREELAYDLELEIKTVNALIKDDEWFNIPAAIRSTCEGIIKFTESLANKIVRGAEKSHEKVERLSSRLRLDASVVKKRIDTLDSMVTRETRKVQGA